MRRTDLVGFAMGPAVNALIGLLAIPLMAWIYKPEDVARFGLFQLAINSFLLVATLGLDQALVREYNETSNLHLLLKNCMAPCLAVISIAASLILINVREFTSALFASPDMSLGMLTVATAFLLCIHRFATLLVRMNSRGVLYSTADLLTKASQLAIMVVAVWLEAFRHASFLMLAYLMSFILSTTILCWAERSTWRTALSASLKTEVMKPLLAFGAPLVASGLAYWALTATGSLSIKWVSTLGELAKYSVALSLSNAAMLFQAIFVLIWTPIVYQWMAADIRIEALETVARRLMAFICLLFTLAGLACGFLGHMLPDHYAQIGQLVPGCLILPLLYTVAEVTGIGIAITRKTSLSIVVSVSALACCMLINGLLTEAYGAAGAAAASAGAGLMFFLTKSELSARVWRPMHRTKLYASAALITGVSIIPALRPELATPVFWLAAAAVVIAACRQDFMASLVWLKSYWRGEKQVEGAPS